MVDLGPLDSNDPRALLHRHQLRRPLDEHKVTLRALLHRIARRCPTHDRASYAVTSRLERQLGMTPSAPPDSFTDTYSDPELIDCGHRWCRVRR